jgi:hypothetical protein
MPLYFGATYLSNQAIYFDFLALPSADPIAPQISGTAKLAKRAT